jgi:hypothetical protein
MPLLSTLKKRYSSMRSFLWLKDGLTAERAADSALAIKALTATTTDGYYWIRQRNGTPVQIFCIMQNIDGGGWMRLNSNVATWSHSRGSSSWSGETRIVNFTQSDAGCAGAPQYTMSNTLNFTEYTLLFQRVTSIGQCSSWTNQNFSGWYDPPYVGTADSYGMCTWGDGVFARGCCDPSLGLSTQKLHWRIKGFNATGNYNISHSLACTNESGQRNEVWWVR